MLNVVEAQVDDLVDALVDDGGKSVCQGAQQIAVIDGRRRGRAMPRRWPRRWCRSEKRLVVGVGHG